MQDRAFVLVGHDPAWWVDVEEVRHLCEVARGVRAPLAKRLPPPEDDAHVRDFPIDLGAGVRARLAELDHGAVTRVTLAFPTIGRLLFDFARSSKSYRGWSLLSSDPLWIEPSIAVAMGEHNVHGFVRNGRWGDTGPGTPGGWYRVESK